jgi:hypothetical protein
MPQAENEPAARQNSVQWFPARTGRTHGSTIAAYVLIVFGVLFLIASVVPLGGGIFLLGLGLVFLVARLTTGRHGYAAPAGILTGLGAYVALNDAGVLPGDNGGWALLGLGLGFLAIYLLTGRPGAYWPIIPGGILAALGLAQIDATAFAPLTAYAWLASYWPVALILLGVWVLARDSMSPDVRAVVGVILIVALILGGALALAAASLEAARSLPGATSVPGTFGNPPATAGQSLTLSAPFGAGQSLRITNLTGGTTRVMSGDGGQVRASVTRPMGWGPPAAVNLTPGGGALTLEARAIGAWPYMSSRADLLVEAPSDAPLSIQSSSGNVTVDDRAATVQIESSSGSISVARVDGPANLRASSGSVQVAKVTGDLDVASSSGSIDANGIRHPRNIQTSSGSISLGGTFGDLTRIQTSSGSVAVQLAPESSTRIVANSVSGDVSTGALALAKVSQAPHSISGTLGSGIGQLTIETTSGAIRLDAAR